MSDLAHVKQQITALSEAQRWELREWLDGHTVDFDASALLRELLHMATDVLGEDYRARRWLLKRNFALGGEVPVIVARRSVEGLDEVRNLLGRIEGGDTFV